MPMFRVTLDRVAANQDLPRNPFFCRIEHMPPVRRLCRTWEFEAKDEADVRRLLDEARAAGVDNVRGFSLRQIARVGGLADARR